MKPSDHPRPSKSEKRKAREMRLEQFEMEPIHDGNTLVRLVDRTKIPDNRQEAVGEKLNLIMDILKQTN